MSDAARITSGVILLTIVAVEYGGIFLLGILRGGNRQGFTDLQRSFFRAGHAHAGVLVILALFAQPLIDLTTIAPELQSLVRSGFGLAAILVPAGFFLSPLGDGTKPNRLITLIYLGATLLGICLVVLGIGLVTAE
jgi:hypothetical protein